MRIFSISRSLGIVADLVRWREWYDSKVPLYLVAMAYAVLRAEDPGETQAERMVALLVLLCCYAAFGHIINDYADRDADRKAGKERLVAQWSEAAVLIALAIPFSAAITIALGCLTRPALALTVASLLMAALYSLPPIRLKERGILGWLAAALAQRTLPAAIIFQSLGGWDAIAVVLSGLCTLIGLRFIIIHQLRDRQNDQRAGVRTAATEFSPQRLLLVLRGLFALEIAVACGVVAMMSYVEPYVGAAAIIYVVGLIVVNRHRRAISALDYFVFYGFYCVIWPITLTLLLVARNPLFLPAPFLVVALVQRHTGIRFRAAFKEPVVTPRPVGGDATDAPSRTLVDRQNPINFQINKGNPYPEYARLRATAAIIKANWTPLGTNWLVTRHREALTVLTDPRFIRNVDGLTSTRSQKRKSREPARGFGRDMVELDPPDHTRLRNLVSHAFTPRTIGLLEPRIEQLANGILDRAKRRGGIELITEYASAIPIAIISELLGVPVDDMQNMRALLYSLSFDELTDWRSSETEMRKRRFTSELEALFAERRAEPRDDLVTALVQAEQDGDRLSHVELIGMVYLLLLAGFVTTVNLIGNGMLALLRHPEQLNILRRNPDLTGTAVEELLRFDSPLELSAVCFAASDIELGGSIIPSGAPVRVLIPSVNRDETQFVASDALDITRDPCPHLSFGQGIHYCLGAPLARLEGKLAIRTLIERAPHLRVADPTLVQWLPHPILRGLRQLPLRL